MFAAMPAGNATVVELRALKFIRSFAILTACDSQTDAN